MTREEKIIKTLEAMRDNSFKIALSYKRDGNDSRYHEMMTDVSALGTALALIQDDDFLDSMAKNYEVK